MPDPRLEPLTESRRPVWVDVIVPPSHGLPAEVIRERRWVDADGNQWRTDDRPLEPGKIVATGKVRQRHMLDHRPITETSDE